MTDRVLAEFGRISTGAAAHSAIELIEETLRDAQYDIDMAMYREIQSGTLTGDKAMIAFARKQALYAVLVHLRQKEITGVNASKRLNNHE